MIAVCMQGLRSDYGESLILGRIRKTTLNWEIEDGIKYFSKRGNL